MLQVLGSIHWHATPEDPFADLDISHEEPPVDLTQTLDEHAAEQFLISIEQVEPELLD
jgi:hypothetical protein